MDDYLAKPVQMAELDRILTQWISSSDGTLVAADMTHKRNIESVLDPYILAQLHALEEPGEEASLLADLLEAFRGSAPGHIKRLKTTLAAGEATAFGDAAHALKGSAGTLGATRLQRAAADLERRGRERDLVHADAQLIALETAYNEALEALIQEVIRRRQELAA
jgi:HPt (histidine-containing phosphotransfer) domain-containing protein